MGDVQVQGLPPGAIVGARLQQDTPPAAPVTPQTTAPQTAPQNPPQIQGLPPGAIVGAPLSGAPTSENESYGTPEEQQAAAARHALTRVGKTNTPEMSSDEITKGLAGFLGGRGPGVSANPEAVRQAAGKLLEGFGVNASKDVQGVGGIARAVPAAIVSSVSGMTYEQAKKAITPHFLSNDQGTGLLDANEKETHGALGTVGGMGEDILSFLAAEGALKGLSLGEKLAKVKSVADILEKGGAAAKAIRIGMNSLRVGSAAGIQTGVRGGTPGEIAASAGLALGGTALIEGTASVLKPAAAKLFSWVNAPKDLEAAQTALQTTREGSPEALAKAKDLALPNKGLEGTELARKVQTDLEAASAKKSTDYEAARNNVTNQVTAAEKAGKPILVGGNGSAIQKQAAEFATAPSGLPEGFQDVFNKVNPATDPKIAPMLAKFADEMTQPMTWDEAEKMRQQIGNAVRNTPYGDPTKWQWISMRTAMDETMEEAATKAGYPEISKDMVTLRSNYADAINRLEKNSVINSLKEKDYDSVAKRLMSGNQVVQNVQDLRATLHSVGGQDTMSAVENSVAQKLIDSATTTTADGTRQVNPNTLANKFFSLSPEVREALWHDDAAKFEKIISDFKTEIESGKAAVRTGQESTLFNSNNAVAKVLGFSGKHIAAAPFLYTAFHKVENGDFSGAAQDVLYGLAAGAGQHVAGKVVANPQVQTKILSFLEYLSHVSETGAAEKGGVASAVPKVPSLQPTGFSSGIPVAGVGETGGEAAAQNAARTGLGAETTVKPTVKPRATVPPERTTGNPEHDAAIREGGGVPGGTMGDVKMFHAPSGTTLGFRSNEPVTAEATRAKIAESTRQYKVGDAINNAVEAKGAGFTFHPQTGEVPTNGFMVETHPEARTTLDHPPTSADIHDFIDKNKELLVSHPELHVGGYGNELNISGRYQTEQDAVNAGKKLDQISAYDLKSQKEIPTGGLNSGEVTNYPIAERHADLTGAKPEVPDRISTRVPTAVKATENALQGEPLIINRDAVDAAPGLAQKMADKVRGYDGVKVPANIKDPAKVLSKFQNHVADNLRWIYNQVPKETQKTNAKWYESAHQIANDISEQHGMQPRQGAAVIASMSPQKDWDMNVSLAHRIADIHHLQGNAMMTPEMEAKGVQLGMKSDDLKELLNDIKGKTYNQLTDPVEKAAWARIFDETYSPRDFSKIDPGTGEPVGLRTNKDGSPSKVAWGSLNEGAKAVSIMQDGSRENISEQLGGAHKVRNFYNNIIDPSDPHSVTIDTHAVAAGHMQPFGGNSAEVLENFKGSGSTKTGVNGTYALYADAYRQVAKEMGIKPRELQSVVWEWTRDRFQNFKTEQGLAFAKEQWALSKAGKITADEARENIANEAQKAIDNAPVVKGKLGKVSAMDFLNKVQDNRSTQAGAEAVKNASFPGDGE